MKNEIDLVKKMCIAGALVGAGLVFYGDSLNKESIEGLGYGFLVGSALSYLPILTGNITDEIIGRFSKKHSLENSIK